MKNSNTCLNQIQRLSIIQSMIEHSWNKATFNYSPTHTVAGRPCMLLKQQTFTCRGHDDDRKHSGGSSSSSSAIPSSTTQERRRKVIARAIAFGPLEDRNIRPPAIYFDTNEPPFILFFSPHERIRKLFKNVLDIQLRKLMLYEEMAKSPSNQSLLSMKKTLNYTEKRLKHEMEGLRCEMTQEEFHKTFFPSKMQQQL